MCLFFRSGTTKNFSGWRGFVTRNTRTCARFRAAMKPISIWIRMMTTISRTKFRVHFCLKVEMTLSENKRFEINWVENPFHILLPKGFLSCHADLEEILVRQMADSFHLAHNFLIVRRALYCWAAMAAIGEPLSNGDLASEFGFKWMF